MRSSLSDVDERGDACLPEGLVEALFDAPIGGPTSGVVSSGNRDDGACAGAAPMCVGSAERS